MLKYLLSAFAAVFALIAPDDSIAAHYDYEPFGRRFYVDADCPPLNSYRYSSGYIDEDLQLAGYVFRYYSPGLGRFLSRDRVPDSMPYGYLRNSVINDFNYLGLASWKCTYCDKDGIRHNENGINCLGYAIGLGYAVAPGSNSLDFLLGLQGFSGLEIPFDDCKCEKCDDVIVYVYVYIKQVCYRRIRFSQF